MVRILSAEVPQCPRHWHFTFSGTSLIIIRALIVFREEPQGVQKRTACWFPNYFYRITDEKKKQTKKTSNFPASGEYLSFQLSVTKNIVKIGSRQINYNLLLCLKSCLD